MLDNEAVLFRPGDERVASLFLWHFVEEVEHRSSALLIYGAVVGRLWYRLQVVPAVVPLREKTASAVRILLSQMLFHNPADEPLPVFADEWFARWDRGFDVTRGTRVNWQNEWGFDGRPVQPDLRQPRPGVGDFSCRGASAIVHLRNPFGLSNWTLPVVELLMVTVALAALVHSVRRLRRDGDPTALALWAATVIYLFVVEIPLYFPNIFGIEDTLGVVFAHNVFSAQFLFDRLPLYIVALYPAVVTLSYEIVRALGVFRDRGALLGAVCVGFVHHCFYEVFDQLGPRLRWWSWNTDNALNHPMLASVPMTSVFIFATLGPIVVTALVLLPVRPLECHSGADAIGPRSTSARRRPSGRSRP